MVDKTLIIPAGMFAGRELANLSFVEATQMMLEIGNTLDPWYKAAKLTRRNAARRELAPIRDMLDQYAEEERLLCPIPAAAETTPYVSIPVPRPKKVTKPRVKKNSVPSSPGLFG